MATLLVVVSTALLVGKPLRAFCGRAAHPTMGLHELSAATIGGVELKMNALAAKPVLMCNVASR